MTKQRGHYKQKPPHVDVFGRKYRAWRWYVWSVTNGLIRSLVLVLVLAGYVIFAERIPHWLTAYFGLVNTATFFVYGRDKLLARRGKFRISEWTLHCWTLAGGSIGAIAGQLIFRHKLYKAGFQFVFDSILLGQAAAIYWFWIRTP